jgi:HAD superfamily hydrolase (TIGR01549 family)
MIENEGGSNTTLRISGVAIALAREHGVNRDDDVKTRFFEILDERMDKSGPDKNLVKMLGKFAREGFRLGIVTFVRKPRISRRLDVWKLKEYFQSVITPDDVADFKPSPHPFVKAMEELRVKPKECFVIGDEPVDMIGGKKAGATTIGLPQGFFRREELENAGADYILSSLDNLASIVSR